MPLLGDGLFGGEQCPVFIYFRHSDHLLLTKEHLPSFPLKPETFLAKETKDRVCQMPDASTAHPVTLLHSSLQDELLFCQGRHWGPASLSEHSIPGSWTLTSPHLHVLNKAGDFVKTQINRWKILACYSLRIGKWDCTVWAFFSDLFQVFLSFPQHTCVCEKNNELFSQTSLERLSVPHGVVKALTVSHSPVW